MRNVAMLSYLVFALALVCACSDRRDIKRDHDFSVETMPVQTKIAKGKTVEIRCKLKRTGRFDETKYTIRYFQPDGKGRLRMEDGALFLPNDRYPLTKELFRLYYISDSTDQQKIDAYVEDDFSKVPQLSFSFTNENPERQNWYTLIYKSAGM